MAKNRITQSVATAPAEPIDPLATLRRHTDDLRAGELEEAREGAEFEANVRRRYVEVISRLDNPQPHDADALIEAANVFKVDPGQVERDALIIRKARELCDLHCRRREVMEQFSLAGAWERSAPRRHHDEARAILHEMAPARDEYRQLQDARRDLEQLAQQRPELFSLVGDVYLPLGVETPEASSEEIVTATRQEIVEAMAEAAAEFDALTKRHRAEQFAAFAKRWKLERQLETLPAPVPVSDEADDQGDGEFSDDLLDDMPADALSEADAA